MAYKPTHSGKSSNNTESGGYRRPPKKKKNRLAYILAAIIAVILAIIIIVMVCTSKKNSDQSSAVSSTTSEIFSSHATSKDKSSSAATSKEESSQSSSKDNSSDEDSEEASSTSSEDEPISSDPDKNISRSLPWNLRLANRSNYISNSDRPTELSIIDAAGREIDSRAYENYEKMVSDATAEGLDLFPISGFRSAGDQTYLFNAELRSVKANYPEYSNDEAYRVAASSVAAPGTSDHELGLAIDFNTDQEWFADSDEGIWLAEHCTDYGFVLRYPADKCDITNIIFEPWHFRYVGIEDAKKMKQLNMCLEEYVEYLVK